jgi:Tol biopolymer transport system component
MFGRSPNNWLLEVPDVKSISILNLDTKQITTLPGSEGLFSGRWSPNGRYVAAMPLSYSKLLLFDFSTQTWSELAGSRKDDPKGFDTPRWSPDSEYIYFNAERWVLTRVGRANHKVEKILDLKTIEPNANYCRFHGIAADGTLLIGCWFEGGDFYALDVDWP